MISEKLFNSFRTAKNRYHSGLSYDELATPFLLLKFGTLEELAKILFQAFDFNSDKRICFSDIQLVMSFLPPKYQGEMPLNTQIEEIANKHGVSAILETNIDFNMFLTIFKESSETNNIFMVFLRFLYENIPLFQETSITKSIKLANSNNSSKKNLDITNDINISVTIDTNTSSMIENSTINLEEHIFVYTKLSPSRKANSTDLKKFHVLNFKLSEKEKKEFALKNMLDVSFQVHNKNLDLNPFKKNLEEIKEEVIIFDNNTKNKVIKEETFYFLKKLDINEEMTTKHLKMINKSLYFYDSKDQLETTSYSSKFHILFGSFIRKNLPKIIMKQTFYSFTLYLTNDKKETLYHTDVNVIAEWIECLRETLNYRNIFDDYTLHTVLGEGSQGKVFYSDEKETGNIVAVKVLAKTKKSCWVNIKTEIDIMKVVSHPNLISFIDNYENSEFNFIVMEYLNNGSLNKYLEAINFKLEDNIFRSIAYQIASGLMHLHSLGIVHRDIKPSNIILSKSDSDKVPVQVKISDFGLSRVLGKSESGNDVGGTFLFLAPEVMKKKPYNYKIDVWCYGITIYYMLFGNYPFQAIKSRDKHSLDYLDYSFKDKLKRKKNSVIADLIIKCLELNPEKRIDVCGVLNHEYFA